MTCHVMVLMFKLILDYDVLDFLLVLVEFLCNYEMNFGKGWL